MLLLLHITNSFGCEDKFIAKTIIAVALVQNIFYLQSHPTISNEQFTYCSIYFKTNA